MNHLYNIYFKIDLPVNLTNSKTFIIKRLNEFIMCVSAVKLRDDPVQVFSECYAKTISLRDRDGLLYVNTHTHAHAYLYTNKDSFEKILIVNQ